MDFQCTLQKRPLRWTESICNISVMDQVEWLRGPNPVNTGFESNLIKSFKCKNAMNTKKNMRKKKKKLQKRKKVVGK